jgi:hypothetical protein
MLVPESARRRSGEEGGFGPAHTVSRGESGIGARTVFTATSDRAVGLLREDGSNGESANVAGDRGGRRVRPGLRPPSGDVGDGDLLERSTGTGKPAAGERCGETTGHARGPRATGDLLPSGDGWHAIFGWGVGNGVVVRSRRIWGHPNWTQRGRFRLAPGPMARATGSA